MLIVIISIIRFSKVRFYNKGAHMSELSRNDAKNIAKEFVRDVASEEELLELIELFIDENPNGEVLKKAREFHNLINE